jgi:hypothetical protein
LIRYKIVEFFRGTDAEPNLDEVAKRLGLDRSDLLSQLNSEKPLDDVAGLTFKDAKRVLRQFDGLQIFAPDLENAITEVDETRAQIREIEKQARGGGSDSGK